LSVTSGYVWKILIRINGGNSSSTTCRQLSNESLPFVAEFRVIYTSFKEKIRPQLFEKSCLLSYWRRSNIAILLLLLLLLL